MDPQTAYAIAADPIVRTSSRVDALYALRKSVVHRNAASLILQTDESRKHVLELASLLMGEGISTVREALRGEPPYRVDAALDRVALGAFACDVAWVPNK